MVPSDYRLDEVAARLIERLEAARPSWTDPAELDAAFQRIASEHVEAAIAEFRSVMPGDPSVDRQAELLRREIGETFLKRVVRLAVAMNEREAGGHGFGPLATSAGRMVLVAGALAVWLALGRYVGAVWSWPLLLAGLTLPVWPDVAGRLAHRAHTRELQSVVDAMQRIQEQATSYLPPEQLDAGRAVPRRDKEGPWPS